MSTIPLETYGLGGYDPNAVDKNLKETRAVAVPVEVVNRSSLQEQAVAALTANRAYISSTPTAQQNTNQIKALSRQTNVLIRLLLDRLDSTD